MSRQHPPELHQNPPFSAVAGYRQHRGVPRELCRWKDLHGGAQTQLPPFRSRRRRVPGEADDGVSPGSHALGGGICTRNCQWAFSSWSRENPDESRDLQQVGGSADVKPRQLQGHMLSAGWVRRSDASIQAQSSDADLDPLQLCYRLPSKVPRIEMSVYTR
ncbi:uncharacterized protein ACIBXB_019696 [Morphnus guianensis]